MRERRRCQRATHFREYRRARESRGLRMRNNDNRFQNSACRFCTIGKLYSPKMFTPRGSTMWSNRTITINIKTVFKQEWYEKLIVDLLDETGQIVQH